jgi:hypothetical protein
MKFCVIVWVDSESDHGWDIAKAPNQPRLAVSSGWLVSESRLYYQLASDFEPDGDNVNRRMDIPKKMVQKKYVIGHPKLKWSFYGKKN